MNDLSGVDDFFESPDLTSTDCLAEILKAFHHIRDCRLLSEMFAPLVHAIGGCPEILVDTGHFRCVFPTVADRLSKHKDMVEYLMPGRGTEPERFLNVRALGGRPHRDIGKSHNTFQYNMWFPLHNIPRDAALLLFPECYHRNLTSPFVDPVDRTISPDDWGYGPAAR